jgi:hypothetical protein
METKNKRGGLKTYQAFTPPSPYEMERRKAEQQRRYAELLQEQAMAEDEPYTYQGIRAMPSPAAALGKLLKAYGAKKASEKADEAEARKAGMEQQASQQIMGRLFGGAPMSQADTTPDESGLAEVAVQSQYRQDPTDAMRLAATPQGVGAMKGNPMLAAMLTKSMEQEKAAKSPYGNIDPSKFTTSSLQAFDASARAGKPDYTLLQPREYAELTPQQEFDIGLKAGQFGIEGGRYNFETGQTAPSLRFPFQSQRAAAQPAAAPPQAAAAPAAQPPVARPVAPTSATAPQAAAPARREMLAGALDKVEEKPKSAFEMATPQQRLKLQQELPQARTAAQVGLTKLDQLDDYLADLEKHGGTENITGLFGQIPIDIAPESRSARKTLESFQQGASIQAINEARQASTTGGAYGNMTVQEWPRLEGVFGAVVAAKDPEAFDLAVKNARAQIEAARNRYISSWNGVYGDMPIGYKRPKYTPESSLYPREKGKGKTGRSSVRDEADAIIRGD